MRVVADHILSTGQMCAFVKENPASEFIVATEEGLIHRLRKDNPGKTFYRVSPFAVCPNMKRNTLEKCITTLGDEWDDVLEHEVTVPEQTRVEALRAVERMLGVGRGAMGVE